MIERTVIAIAADAPFINNYERITGLLRRRGRDARRSKLWNQNGDAAHAGNIYRSYHNE